MAGVEKHVEKFENENDTAADSTTDAVPTVPPVSDHERVCTIVPSTDSNEILLYVGDGNNQGVQDLLRVALNQPLGQTPNEIQQQLQDANSKLSYQTIGGTNTHTIISVPVSGISAGNTVTLIPSEEINSGHEQASTDDNHHSDSAHVISSMKKEELNSLFQLANLTAEPEKIQGVVDHVGVGVHMDSEVLKVENEGMIGDFIIANVDTTENELIPGELNIGDSFYCLEDVEDALRLYEEKNAVKLYKRDVRSLEALLKRSLKLQKLDKINERLKYGQLLYYCVYGGKRKAQKMACMDESGYARYTDCKMFIRFAISDDGMKLIVNGKNEIHNHDEVVTNEQEPELQYFTNTGNASEIRLGAGFVDLEELYKAVHKYETDNHVHLWRRDGRTVEALSKRAPGTARKIMETNPGLRFAELRFCCSYGGRQFTEDKKDKKPPQ